jgi:hypothetical protein
MVSEALERLQAFDERLQLRRPLAEALRLRLLFALAQDARPN